MESISQALQIPDPWQREAFHALRDGADVIVDAPTGAGKTLVFELFVEHGIPGQAVYTVPTRALANDKRIEWARRGWRVGITTGDISDDPEAPVVVATLETWKPRFVRGEAGPALLVLDEYQMIGDPGRGLNYEITVALAPPTTRLLLLSGSVSNPEEVAGWLRRLGRKVVVVRHAERPVPLEEVPLEALPDRGVPDSVRQGWPRLITRALRADLGPILAFAPKRKAAELLARQMSADLPCEDPLVLSPEQAQLAGDDLARLLRNRVAFHHSGLTYRQRAGLVEPLAKNGQLRVVVATTGLAAGINFSLRSVLVTDREYRSGMESRLLRPDELLQMFGRAGRRGLDTRGHVLVVPTKPRLAEGRQRPLRRAGPVEWPALLAVMAAAHARGEPPLEAARAVLGRLFATQVPEIGDLASLEVPVPATAPEDARESVTPTPRGPTSTVIEILGRDGRWDRRRPVVRRRLGDCWSYDGKAWVPATADARALDAYPEGATCRLAPAEDGSTRYGKEFPLARIGDPAKSEPELVPTKWLKRVATEHRAPLPRNLTLAWLENRLVPCLAEWLPGIGVPAMTERGGQIRAVADVSAFEVTCTPDHDGTGLINPPERHRTESRSFAALLDGDAAATSSTRPDRLPETAPGTEAPKPRTPLARTWLELGLVDTRGVPTRRGRIFACFHAGEGLAVAAALEDESYPIAELVFDLANLRAGHRFGHLEAVSNRLASRCRQVFGLRTLDPYLRLGLPPAFGEGAAEALRTVAAEPGSFRRLASGEFGWGDLERARLEWLSLLRQVAHAAGGPAWSRWDELRRDAAALLAAQPGETSVLDLPPLTARQQRARTTVGDP